MKNRRTFLKTSAIGLTSLPFIPFQSLSFVPSPGAVVKQPEECETVWVRENTPITFHLSKTIDGVPVSLLSEELLPGGRIPAHKHLNEDEFFFFITGTGEVTIDDKIFPFKPGTTAFIPRNTWHSFINSGNEKAFFSFGYSPAGFEDFFRQIGTPKLESFRPKPKAEADAIAKRFGMVFR